MAYYYLRALSYSVRMPTKTHIGPKESSPFDRLSGGPDEAQDGLNRTLHRTVLPVMPLFDEEWRQSTKARP
jgi:hypothetical protein